MTWGESGVSDVFHFCWTLWSMDCLTALVHGRRGAEVCFHAYFGFLYGEADTLYHCVYRKQRRGCVDI